jgi:hypothetical protein
MTNPHGSYCSCYHCENARQAVANAAGRAYGIFQWTADNRYPRADAIHVYARERDAQHRADKLNSDPETFVPRGWVVRSLSDAS